MSGKANSKYYRYEIQTRYIQWSYTTTPTTDYQRQALKPRSRSDEFSNGTGQGTMDSCRYHALTLPLGGAVSDSCRYHALTLPLGGAVSDSCRYHALTLPLGGAVSDKLVKSALKGEFINLSEFLPNIYDVVTEMETYVTSEGSVQVRPKRQKKVIYSLTSWSSAWSNYEVSIVPQRPELNIEIIYNLVKRNTSSIRYTPIIADLERGWQAANHGISTLPTPISITTLDATTLKRGAKQCFRSRTFDHTVHNCPFPVTSAVDEETKKNPTPRVIRDKWIHQGK